MRKGEYHMEVGSINDFRPAFVHPELRMNRLAVGAVAVAAGVIVELHMPAVRALGKIGPEFSGFTVQDRLGNFALDIRLKEAGRSIVRIGVFPDLLDI